MAEEPGTEFEDTILGQIARIEAAKDDILDKVREKGVTIQDEANIRLNDVPELILAIPQNTELESLTKDLIIIKNNEAIIRKGYKTVEPITITLDEIGADALERLSKI